MTSSSHTRLVSLDAETFREKGFENRTDPLTLEPFRIGDRVRLCVKCDAAFLNDSWNSTGSVCGCFENKRKFDLRGGRRGLGREWSWILKGILALMLIIAIAYILLR